MANRYRVGAGGSGGGGGGGGGDATISGNSIETLFQDSSDYTLGGSTGSGGTTPRTITLSRSLTSDDVGKLLRILTTDETTSGMRNQDSWPATVTDFQEQHEVYVTQALIDGTLGMLLESYSNTDGAIGWAGARAQMPAANQLKFSYRTHATGRTVRHTVLLIPEAAHIDVSGGGGGGGDDDFDVVEGLPDPSAENENTVVVNDIDRRSYICKNEPKVNTAPTATVVDLDTYYTTDDADLSVHHDLPGVSSSIDDTWIYIDSGPHRDKFYFGDTAPGGNYAWYEDSPADALREVCRAYVENVASTSLANLGAGAPVVYLGQRHSKEDALAALTGRTVDHTTTYYVYWSIPDDVFKIIEDDYVAPGTVTNHYRWRNVRAEAIYPVLRPNLDGSFPAANKELFDEKAVLIDWEAQNWNIKHSGHGVQSARGTWTGYGVGDTVPDLFHTDTYRGVVDNVSQVTSPSNRDVVVVKSGTHAALEIYLSAGAAGWYAYNSPFDRLIGAFHHLEDADSRVGSWNGSSSVYCVVGYRLYKLTAFVPGTAATHRYTWTPARKKRRVELSAENASAEDLSQQVHRVTLSVSLSDVDDEDDIEILLRGDGDHSWLCEPIRIDALRLKTRGATTLADNATISGSSVASTDTDKFILCKIDRGDGDQATDFGHDTLYVGRVDNTTLAMWTGHQNGDWSYVTVNLLRNG